MERLRIQAPHPSPRKMAEVIHRLREGGIVAQPTDSLMSIACDPSLKKSVIRLCEIKGLDPQKANLTYLCKDLGSASKLFRQLDKELFKLINRNIPGPFTFILPASKQVPHHFSNKKRTIGIRIPHHYWLGGILELYSGPLLTSSLPQNSEEESMEPEELIKIYQAKIDLWVDDESAQGVPTSVVDCTVWPVEILRDAGHQLA